MKVLDFGKLLLLFGLASALATQPGQFVLGQSPSNELFNQIAALDTALFEAYNKCDLEKQGSFLAEDVEFYHDKGGLLTSRRKVMEAIKANICGRVSRELVAGTMQVYPIPGYGAIETGTHRFHNRQEGTTGESKFLHIWQNKDGQWKLTRVVSYAH